MAPKKAAKKKTAKKKVAAKKLPSEEKRTAAKARPASRSVKQRYLLLGALIGLLMGLALGGIFLQNYLKLPGQEVRTYCEVDYQSLWGKECSVHEDCYGRVELCSPSAKKCIATANVDKGSARNVLIPTTKLECELNGGIWITEKVGEIIDTSITGNFIRVMSERPQTRPITATQQVVSEEPVQNVQPISQGEFQPITQEVGLAQNAQPIVVG